MHQAGREGGEAELAGLTARRLALGDGGVNQRQVSPRV
jgi:hypothetical protein